MNQLGNHLEVYQASAGSGKTYTLVKQYLSIAFQQPDYKFRQVLALTFTNDAAHEMKARVIEALKAIVSHSDEGLIANYASDFNLSTEEVVDRATGVLEGILSNYDGLSIMTIDAFQQRVVKGFTTELGLPNDFNTLIENLSLQEEILASLVNQIGVEKEFTSIAMLHQKELLKDDKNWDLTDIVETALQKVWNQKGRKTGASPAQFIAVYQEVGKRVNTFLKLVDEVKEEVEQIYAKIGYTMKDMNARCKHKTFLNKLHERNFGAIFAAKNGSPYLYMEEYRTTFREKGKNYGAGKVQDKKAFDEITITEVMPLFEKVLDAFQAIPAEQFLYFWHNSQFIELAFTEFIQDFFYKIKEQRSMVSIGDSELIINKLIQADELPFIYEKLGLRYKYILIDEFQDTSTKQWQNLKPLVNESLANGAYSMIVGDVKQSIYSWRGGEPQQFVDLFHQKDAELRVKPSTLDTNYRSYPQIVNFNNTFFEKLYGYKDLRVYDAFENGAQKVFDLKYKGKEDLGYIHADLVLEASREDKEEKFEKYYENLVERIEWYVSQGYRYADICILDRNNAHLAYIALILQEKGIPSVVEGKLLLIDNPLIKGFESLVLNYLGINTALNQRIVLETFAMYGKQDLETLETKYYEGNQLNWKLFCQDFGLDAYTSKDILLNLWQAFKSNKNIQIPNTQYLRIFEEIIYDLEKKNAAINLEDFWLYWEIERAKLSLPDISNFNGIRLMTIHKSKGLEYPVVFYVNVHLGNAKTIEKEIEIDIASNEERIAVGLSDKVRTTLDAMGVSYQEDILNYYLEEANIVYVAFTRAKIALDILILNTCTSDFIHSYVCEILLDMIADAGEEGHQFEIGKLPPMHHNDQKETKQQITLPDLYYNRLKSLVSGGQEQSEEQEYGIAFHEAISKFQTPQDFINKGEGLQKIAPQIYENVKAFFEHSEVLDLFENTLETMEEESFYDGSDQLRQPDKVIVKKEETIIIDFKTGQENEAYEEQLAIYEGIFKQLGYPNVKKYVYYTQGNELVQI